MATIKWRKNLSVGIMRIDLHNQHLLRLLHGLHEALRKGCDKADLKFDFAELVDYSVFHFACEEIWMSRTHYRQVMEHEEDHKRIILRLCKLYKDLQNGCDLTLRELSTLITLLIIHFKEFDASFGRFVLENKLSTTLMAPVPRHKYF